MKKILLPFILVFITNCTLDKVVIHHGVHNLEKKQVKLKINETNKNDIIELIGPPSTKSSFDNDVYIYIERKTTKGSLMKLGSNKLIVNNVLVLEINNYGILEKKDFLNIDDMKKIKFSENKTDAALLKRSFIYDFLSSMRQKINDPVGKRRKRAK